MRNINSHVIDAQQSKASICERFNRTLGSKVWKLFSLQGNYKWLDVLPDLIKCYNKSRHRIIDRTEGYFQLLFRVNHVKFRADVALFPLFFNLSHQTPNVIVKAYGCFNDITFDAFGFLIASSPSTLTL